MTKLYLIIRNGKSILPLGQVASSEGMWSVQNFNVYTSQDYTIHKLKELAVAYGATLYDVTDFYPSYITYTGERTRYHIKYNTVWDFIKSNKAKYEVR